MVEMAIFNIQRAISLKVGKQELWFMCSARCLMVFNICVKFHEADKKIVNRQRHTHTHRIDENYIPPLHTSYTRGITIYPIAYFLCGV